MKCSMCNGRLGGYSGEDGVWWTCLECEEGRAYEKRISTSQKECDEVCKRKLEELNLSLEEWKIKDAKQREASAR